MSTDLCVVTYDFSEGNRHVLSPQRPIRQRQMPADSDCDDRLEGDADRSRSTPNPFHWSYVLYFVYGFDVSLLSPYATPCSGLMVSVW